jgi:hydrogenase expression/formation protein HypE
MRAHQHGRQASIIGTVTEDSNCLVQMRTRFGGARVVDWLAGEQFPRIC